MKVDVKKVNERWKRWSIGIFVAMLWVGHLGTATWFVTHRETIKADVLERHDHLFPTSGRGRHGRHGWSCLDVTYVNAGGQVDRKVVAWRASRPPKTTPVELWRADSGLFELGPASYAEAFWVEVWLLWLAAFIGALILAGKAYDRLRGIRRR